MLSEEWPTQNLWRFDYLLIYYWKLRIHPGSDGVCLWSQHLGGEGIEFQASLVYNMSLGQSGLCKEILSQKTNKTPSALDTNIWNQIFLFWEIQFWEWQYGRILNYQGLFVVGLFACEFFKLFLVWTTASFHFNKQT